MTTTSSTRRLYLVTLAVAGLAFLAEPEAQAITFGEPDCIDNATNTGCLHPNTVQLSGFRRGERRVLMSTVRCTGTLLAKSPERFIILTAGHCVATWLERLWTGQNVATGVSFDAEINRDLPPYGWTSSQYILGGQPLLFSEYGPNNRTGMVRYDYGVVVFDIPEALRVTADREGRPRGEFVDFSLLEPITLPEYDYLADKVRGSEQLLVTNVGYGQAEGFNEPGEGGNAKGIFRNRDNIGTRWMTEYTSIFSFMGPDRHMFTTSQNPARGYEGGCFGDSGGPLFYVDQGVEIQVGIFSAIDFVCRATGSHMRTDSEQFMSFADCVMAPDAGLEDILACGCTEVNEKGVCP